MALREGLVPFHLYTTNGLFWMTQDLSHRKIRAVVPLRRQREAEAELLPLLSSLVPAEINCPFSWNINSCVSTQRYCFTAGAARALAFSCVQ